MLYKSTKPAYELLGAYHVRRKPMGMAWDKNRKYTAISYRIKGSSTFHCNGQDFYVGDGDALYIPAGVDYCHENGDEEIYVIHLHCHNPSVKSICHIPGSQELAQAFSKVVQLWQENKSYHHAMSALHQLLDLLERQAEETKSVPAVIAPGVEMLRKEFRDPGLTVAKLAESCFISQVYFRKLYRRHFGISPLQAITNLRFEYAANLLRSGYYTPKQAADLSGFSDVKYFRTAFCKHFGCTPSEFIHSKIL